MGEAAAEFFVRTAMQADMEAIRALLVETWHHTYDALIGAQKVTEFTDTWHSIEALGQRLDRPRSEFIVADSGKCIAGVAFAETVEEGKTVMLRQLYVLPSLQRQGIGSLLLDEIAGGFPEARRMRLEVEEENLPAVAFYRAQGFAEIGRIRDSLGLSLIVCERPALPTDN